DGPESTPSVSVFLVFFFQAEDGIRDGHVTGVQTCALPIYAAADGRRRRFARGGRRRSRGPRDMSGRAGPGGLGASARPASSGRRSEERRVGKEWRSGWWGDH